MRMENVLVVVITVLVLVVLVTVNNKNNKKEDFINVRAYGQSFGQYYPPNPNPNPHPPSCQLNTFPNPSACTPENNCFPGAQLRTQVYQNLCNDPSSGINKLPVQIGDTCLRTHNPNMSPNLLNLRCGRNRDGQINCSY
jgi:hypothetical protein